MIYIVLVSAALYKIKADAITQNIFLVVVYAFSLRLGYNLLFGRFRLLNWRMQITHAVVASVLAWVVYRQLIVVKSHLVPDFSSMANQLWIVIAAFIYALFNKITISTDSADRRKRQYIDSRYKTYRARYIDIIRSEVRDSRLEALVFAIMIHEDFNRPPVFRAVERALFFVGAAKTLGIMQVQSDRCISDSESVRMACQRLASDFNAATDKLGTDQLYGTSEAYWRKQQKEREELRKIMGRYNRSTEYCDEVQRLYDLIRYSHYRDSTIVET